MVEEILKQPKALGTKLTLNLKRSGLMTRFIGPFSYLVFIRRTIFTKCIVSMDFLLQQFFLSANVAGNFSVLL